MKPVLDGAPSCDVCSTLFIPLGCGFRRRFSSTGAYSHGPLAPFHSWMWKRYGSIFNPDLQSSWTYMCRSACVTSGSVIRSTWQRFLRLWDEDLWFTPAGICSHNIVHRFSHGGSRTAGGNRRSQCDLLCKHKRIYELIASEFSWRFNFGRSHAAFPRVRILNSAWTCLHAPPSQSHARRRSARGREQSSILLLS